MASGVIELQRTRTRRRRRMSTEDRGKIASRVIDFFNEDDQARSEDQDRRIELYAKVRGWAEEDSGDPWPNSSNFALPDISTAVEQTQDTLVNAALATRPTVNAKATGGQGMESERNLSQLLDHQFYEEQPGEQVMHELAQTFASDGSYVAFVPWITEWRELSERNIYPPMDEMAVPKDHFGNLIKQRFPGEGVDAYPVDDDGFSWRVEEGRMLRRVEFYTRDVDIPEDAPDKSPDIEMVVSYRAKVYDGPRTLVKDFEDVLTPPRSANLQIHGSSNPGGASHVILRDFPSHDEIVRLQRGGEYNLVTKKKVLEIAGTQDSKDVPEKTQIDVVQGEEPDKVPLENADKTLTRLMCFDVFDFGDGKGAVDVVWTVLKEPRLLVKAELLTELYPVPEGEMPMRPLAEASYLPVKGRRQGRGLPELMEGIHDYIKQRWDQVADAGDMATTPFFFYKPSSDMNPEITEIAPGQGYPINDPKNDVLFPQMPTNGMAFGLNMITLATQLEEKLVVMGDIQQGRIPAGKSSAFRTTGNLQQLLAQGEARPERVLRRFFMGIRDIFKLMHRANQFHLPAEKTFRVVGFLEPGEDPYKSITREDINNDRFAFTFAANIQNASLQAQQESMMFMHQLLVDPISVQMGISTPDTIYRLKRDIAKTSGNDPEPYMVAPTPMSRRMPITAESALSMILNDELPDGFPVEGAEPHLMQLQKILKTPVKGVDGQVAQPLELFTEKQTLILEEYMKGVAQRAQAEKEQQANVAAATATQTANQQGASPGAPTTNPPSAGGPPEVGENQLLNEELPTAGGGANTNAT